ncbi:MULTISPECIES: hypothetical protein [unclassified Halobacterium]|jgi:uncharacterized membrane protein YjdF|uniref:hypothetical protein n=1 Tax=unclassified Halobacterium TaxID=2668073 RepID=UPI001E642764|nr:MULTISPECIES: hypothetical protein [unclassified Halobacterium]MCD2198975.1 hypothetical protein [Halobacterium sp. KA-4]MCD2202993.1 hypothetical protein [Halobacterium sp. KA-6]
MTLLPRPAPATQRAITRTMQVVLAGLVVYGFLRGNSKAVVNGSITLLITFVPALLERRYDLPLDPWLALWLTAAVFLHVLGSSGLYVHIPWWDHVTHALSASLVAGAGYTVARAIDLHHEEITIPSRIAFVYLFVVVLSFGVVWELFEFALDVASQETGLTMPLAQHGLDDTVKDFMYNSLGALVVGVFGQAHLVGVAETVEDWWLAR